MATEILKFGDTASGADILTQAAYAADPQRNIGNQPGIARRALVNKAARQAAYMANALATLVTTLSGSDVLDDNNTAVLIAQMQTAFQTFGSPSGAVTQYLGTTSPTGWLLLNGLTVGNVTSNATARNNADTATLFSILWNSTTNTDLPIQDSAGTPTSRGASASADFAASKRMPLPDCRNVFIRGVNASTRTISAISYPAVGMCTTTLDKLQGHYHNGAAAGGAGSSTVPNYTVGTALYNPDVYGGTATRIVTDGANGTPRVGSETAPVNIGMNYIVKL